MIKSTDLHRPEEVISSALFAVGDFVIATRNISNLAIKGDVLKVKEVRCNGWYGVIHEKENGGAGFLLRHRELAPANNELSH